MYKKFLLCALCLTLAPCALHAMKPKHAEGETCLEYTTQGVCQKYGKSVKSTPMIPLTKHPKLHPTTQALFDAIEKGDTKGAQDALEKGADINALNAKGYTPFAWIITTQGNSNAKILILATLLLQDKNFNPLKKVEANGMKNMPLAFMLIQTGTPVARELLKRIIKHPRFDILETYNGMSLKDFAEKHKENLPKDFIKFIANAQQEAHEKKKELLSHQKRTEEWELYGENIAE